MNQFKSRIDEWRPRLAAWQRRFDQEYAALARKRKGLFRKLSAGERDELATLARRAAGEELAVELHAFLIELVDAYLAEKLPQPRAKVRAWIGANEELLAAVWSLALQSCDGVRRPSDVGELRRALAALSIDDLRTDYNAVVEVLGRLWLAARKAGIDPAPHFAAVAELSNPGMGGGGACTAQLLDEFGASAYFREHVRPLLPRASA